MSKKKNRNNDIYNQMYSNQSNEGITDESSVDSIEDNTEVNDVSEEVDSTSEENVSNEEVTPQEPQSQESDETKTEDVSEEPKEEAEEKNEEISSTEEAKPEVTNDVEELKEKPAEESKEEESKEKIDEVSKDSNNILPELVSQIEDSKLLEFFDQQYEKFKEDKNESKNKYITLIDREAEKLNSDIIRERMDKTGLEYTMFIDDNGNANIKVGPFEDDNTAKAAFRKIQGKGLRPCFTEK